MTSRSGHYAIGIYHLLRSQDIGVKECQCRNLQVWLPWHHQAKRAKKFVIYVYELSTSNDTEFEHNIIRGELHGVTQNELDYIVVI